MRGKAFYRRIEAGLHRRIARELRFAERIVDIGCGDCRLTRLLAGEGGDRGGGEMPRTYRRQRERRVTGIDVSEAEFPKPGMPRGRLRCVKADARALGFLRTGAFDAAVSLYSLHELKAPMACLRELRRLLRPGGELLIVDFPRGSLAQRLWDEGYYTTAEVAGMLKRAGFVRVSASRTARRQITWAKAFRRGAGNGSR
ncbi:MAG: class I SAM-dependent methyltransferase [Planctomycetes bacterium]|nr:class I SAM-dependent methyltransferase [Planctomycetota bacterium]